MYICIKIHLNLKNYFPDRNVVGCWQNLHGPYPVGTSVAIGVVIVATGVVVIRKVVVVFGSVVVNREICVVGAVVVFVGVSVGVVGTVVFVEAVIVWSCVVVVCVGGFVKDVVLVGSVGCAVVDTDERIELPLQTPQ